MSGGAPQPSDERGGGPGALAPTTSPVAVPVVGRLGRVGGRAAGALVAAGFDPRGALARTVGSLPAIVQLVLAVSVSYALTHVVLGHAVPLLAVTVTLTSLGLARDARPRQVLETAVGVVSGIALSELLLLVLGKGLWQVGVVLLVVLVVGRFASPSAGFTIAAATQSMLVVLLPDPDGGPFVRSVDGSVGGLVALAVTALVPRGVVRTVHRDAQALVAELDGALGALVDALLTDDVRRADAAVRRLRATQPLLDAWGSSLDAARSTARFSPFLRPRAAHLLQVEELRRDLDLAVRNLRVIARRIDTSIGDGRVRTEVAGVVAELRVAVQLLGASVEEPGRGDDPRGDALRGDARERLTAVARQLDPTVLVAGQPVTEQIVVLMLRPLVVDLLMATGLPHARARALLAPL